MFSLDVRQQYAACASRANVMQSDVACIVALDVYSKTPFLNKHRFQHFEAFPVGLMGQRGRIVQQGHCASGPAGAAVSCVFVFHRSVCEM